MLSQEPPRPRKREGGSFVARQKQCDDFVSKLAGGHARAIFVLRMEKHGAQVAGVLAGSTALADDAIHNFVEAARRQGSANVAPSWHTRPRPDEPPDSGPALHH